MNPVDGTENLAEGEIDEGIYGRAYESLHQKSPLIRVSLTKKSDLSPNL